MVWTRRRARALGIALALGVGLGMAGFSVHDVHRGSEAERRARGVALERLATNANLLLRERDARIASELGRLRQVLRSGDVWIEGTASSTADAAAEGRETADRRLRAVLRGGLEGLSAARVLEVVVAGESGLVHTRLHRAGDTDEASEETKPGSLAKALWYAEDVRRAVSAAGRRVARGEVDLAGRRDAPLLRFSVALHDPDEVVQGVLIASIDLTTTIDAVEALAGPGQTLRLVSALGRVLGDADPGRLVEAPEARWVLEALGRGRAGEALVSDGRIVVVSPLESGGGTTGSIVVVAAAEMPATGLEAWVRSPWPVALLGLVLVAALGLGLTRSPRESPRVASEDREADAPEVGAIADEAGCPAPGPPAVLDEDDEPEEEDGGLWASDRREGADTDSGYGEAGVASAGDAPGSARAAAGTASEEGTVAADGESTAEAPVEAAGVAVAPESFALRDWLADVRSCLEREAARRGLGLDVRCARMLPGEVESDPAWLGGLVVAWGREALDATADDQVVLDVIADAGGGLRFRLDAGAESLSPVAGMETIAGRLGARFERGEDGRHALVLTLPAH